MNLYLVTVEIYKSRFARVEVSSQNEITIITHAKKNTPCWVSFDAIILAQDTEQAVQITRLNLRAGTTDGSNRFTVQILYESIHKNNSINDEFINPKILAFAGSNVDLIQPVEGKL